MKKTALIIFLCLCFYPATQAVDNSENTTPVWPGWTLIGADVVLCGTTVWAVTDEINADNNYMNLRGQINNTTMASYNQLQSQENQVNGKYNTAFYLGIATGALIAYTAVDYFWLHYVFQAAKVGVEVNFNPFQKECTFAINKEF